MLPLLLSVTLAQAGWTPAGDLKNYEVTTTASVCPSQGADRAFLLRSTAPTAATGVSIVQRFDARAYAGARVRFSAALIAREVHGGAGLFARVIAGEHALVNDEMRGRLLRGTVTCERFSVVIDVPPAAELARLVAPAISVGATLHGTGELELSDVRFERVEPDVPLTLVAAPAPAAATPPVVSGAPPRAPAVSGPPIITRKNSAPSRAPPPVQRNSTNPP